MGRYKGWFGGRGWHKILGFLDTREKRNLNKILIYRNSLNCNLHSAMTTGPHRWNDFLVSNLESKE